MVLLVSIAVLFVSLAVLAKASETSVHHATRLSKALGISEITVGFIFLAVMTSLPELAVTVFSGLSGSTLGVATLFGSNIADIAIVFAAMAFVATFYISKKDLMGIEQALLLTAIVALFALVLGGVNFTFGVFAVLIFAGVSYMLVKEGYARDGKSAGRKGAAKQFSALLISVVVVVLSADFITKSSIEIAQAFSMSEAIIGATIVAVGTSLPELAVSVQAIRYRRPQIAVGNIIGSLVANLTLLLGIGGLISAITFDAATRVTILFMFATYAVFYILARNGRLGLREAFLLSATYAVFAALLLIGVQI